MEELEREIEIGMSVARAIRQASAQAVQYFIVVNYGECDEAFQLLIRVLQEHGYDLDQITIPPSRWTVRLPNGAQICVSDGVLRR